MSAGEGFSATDNYGRSEWSFAVLAKKCGIEMTECDIIEENGRAHFIVVVRNQDDHTKNISFLMDRNGEWRLSPAYDVGYNYNPTGDWASQHQMSVNGKFVDICKSDLIEFADKNNIDKADEIIGQVVETCSQWPSVAKACGLPQSFVNRRFADFEFLDKEQMT